MSKKTLFICFLFVFTPVLWAQQICPLNNQAIKPKEIVSLEAFKKIAVLDNGRIKPLDTYAENVLLQFSGKRTLNKKRAVYWLARLLFAPEFTRDDKIFLINNPALVQSLGVNEDKKRRYSYNELQPAFEKITTLSQAANAINEKERDVVENEVIRLFNNLQLYSSLSLSFSFAFPHEDFLIKESRNIKDLGLSENRNPFSFYDLAMKANRLHQLTLPLEKLPQKKWTQAQLELVELASKLFSWSLAYQNLALHIIPSYSLEETWYTPWDAISSNSNTQEGRLEITALRNMLLAYWSGNQIEFDFAVKNFNHSLKKRMESTASHALRSISLEILFNKLRLLDWAKGVYLLAFLAFLLSLAQQRFSLYPLALIFLIGGFIAHTSAIIVRCIILERPPVSSLYETFIFVSFVSLIAGFIIERINKNWVGIVIASLSGSIFLTIAQKFSMEGDTLKMLVAVLNSNFWLGTHVLSITTGYAGTCVAGIVGHIYILQRIFKPQDIKLLNSTYKILLGTLGFGLTMTFLGTNLGGIWADESWGRFWGWDPKENGALMIVLWTAMLFHAKIAKLIGPLGLAVGSTLGIMVVMWAWFGVNLLSVGLHSYGFTSGLVMNLLIYAVCQILFLLIFAPLAKKKV